MNIELTPEHEKILSELSSAKGYVKNDLLDRYKKQRVEIKYVLDQKILEAEFNVEKTKNILRILKEKRDSIKYYDDGIDPY